MLKVMSFSLLCAAMTSLSWGFAATDCPRSLHQDELAAIDGGQIFYCSSPVNNPTNMGCQECLLVQAKWIYFDPGSGPQFVDIYKEVYERLAG